MNAQLDGDRRSGADAPERWPGGLYVHESGTPDSPAIVFIHGLGQSGRERVR